MERTDLLYKGLKPADVRFLSSFLNGGGRLPRGTGRVSQRAVRRPGQMRHATVADGQGDSGQTPREHRENLAKGHRINQQSSMDGKHYPRHVTNFMEGKLD